MSAPATPLVPPNILIVDDAPANLQLLIAMLRERGYKARAVRTGELALNTVRYSPPDLILLDINLPTMDGYEVCRQLKADPQLREIPILFISGNTQSLDKVKAFEAGGVDYVTKPFELREVEARIHTHLEIARQKRQLQENYRQLQSLESQRDNLMHLLVHDMSAPVFSLLTILDLLRENPLARDPEAVRLLDTAGKSSQRLRELIRQLLDIARLEAGQMPLKPVRCDLLALAQSALEQVTFASTRGRRFVLPPDTTEVLCDPELIRRVLANLVGNACKFTPASEEIRIQFGRQGDWMRVAVSDKGAGIAPEFHATIFEKFGQVNGSNKRFGYGLGLAFCKLAVVAHGGSIGVESQPGAGSTFWFTLPAPTPGDE